MDLLLLLQPSGGLRCRLHATCERGLGYAKTISLSHCADASQLLPVQALSCLSICDLSLMFVLGICMKLLLLLLISYIARWSAAWWHFRHSRRYSSALRLLSSIVVCLNCVQSSQLLKRLLKHTHEGTHRYLQEYTQPTRSSKSSMFRTDPKLISSPGAAANVWLKRKC